MKGTEQFKDIISKHLEGVAAKDAVFAEKMSNPKKNIDDCIKYILNTVQKSGSNGFADDEIFGMAIHYYDEEDVRVGGVANCKVVVNHTAELTDEDIAKAKQEAIDKLVAEEAEHMKKKKKKSQPKQEQSVIQTKMFDL
jgi:hypothetical protein